MVVRKKQKKTVIVFNTKYSVPKIAHQSYLTLIENQWLYSWSRTVKTVISLLSLNILLRQPKVAILKWPTLMADSSKFRGICHNLEESDRRIGHNLEKSFYIYCLIRLLENYRYQITFIKAFLLLEHDISVNHTLKSINFGRPAITLQYADFLSLDDLFYLAL